MLLVGTILGGMSAPLYAQDVTQADPAAQPAAVPVAAATGTIRSISVRGAERLEPATVISYSNLQPGQEYSAESLDAALRELYATELFADVVITGAETGNLTITVRENPVINRIVLEGNKRIKDDKIQPEIRLAPRQIFTRSKVRGDVDRIIERVKICRGASRISGWILSSLMRLLPSRTMRLMTGFSRTWMTIAPVSAPRIWTSANSSVA